MSSLAFPNYYVLTAHDDPVAHLGQKFTNIDAMDILGSTAVASGGVSDAPSQVSDQYMGYWDIMYVQAYAAVTAGQAVQSHYQKATASGAGTTTTFVDAGAFTADEWNGALFHITKDAGAGTATEHWAWVTDNDANTITFTPADSGSSGGGDVAILLHQYKCEPTGATSANPLGLALSTATAGQYLFVLRSGLYLNAAFATTTAVGQGDALTTASSGNFQVAVAGDLICGYAPLERDAAEVGTAGGIVMTLP